MGPYNTYGGNSPFAPLPGYPVANQVLPGPTFDGLYEQNRTSDPYVETALNSIDGMQQSLFNSAGSGFAPIPQNQSIFGQNSSDPNMQWYSNTISPLMGGAQEIYNSVMNPQPTYNNTYGNSYGNPYTNNINQTFSPYTNSYNSGYATPPYPYSNNSINPGYATQPYPLQPPIEAPLPAAGLEAAPKSDNKNSMLVDSLGWGAAGALIGTAITPGVGTAVGAVAGGLVGAMKSLLF